MHRQAITPLRQVTLPKRSGSDTLCLRAAPDICAFVQPSQAGKMDVCVALSLVSRPEIMHRHIDTICVGCSVDGLTPAP